MEGAGGEDPSNIIGYQAIPEEEFTFFRLLLFYLKSIHKSQRYFGNVPNGLRIQNNRRIFLIPAKFEVTQLDEGILSDLRGVHNMLANSDLRYSRHHEWVLFQELYTNCVGHGVAPPKRGDELRDACFLTLSSHITYIDCELYDLVRKLGEYQALDSQAYSNLTFDQNPTFHWA